ncbi:hypothetical protein ACS0TY_010662 [Phlomoides rotata]
MSKASVIIYITVAVVLLLLVSRSSNNNKPQSHRHRGRRLKLRSSFTFTGPATHRHRDRSAPFDPLVADIELKREDKEWEQHYLNTRHPESAHSAPGHESQPEWEDFMDAEDYLNDEERFNVTDRLLLLFPKIDVDPTDGYVSEHELTHWNMQQTQREAMHRSQREMETHDKNKNGFVSFAEYEPPSWFKKSDNTSYAYDAGWWTEEHFNASDADNDGLLNITEFNDFLHPADTNSSKLLLWLCKEEIRERDSDKDGKVNFKEFFHGLFDLVRDYDEMGLNSSNDSDDSQENPAKILFAQLDKDDNGYLSDVELLPIVGKLHPSEHYYAKQQTEYIMNQADADKDGRLTLTEVIESPYVFYSAVFNEDEDGDYGLHDEFR